MSDFRLRRARSMEIFSRSDYGLRAPDPISRVDSVHDLSSMATGHYGDYLYRRPYLYGSYLPPSIHGRRFYPSEGTVTDAYPTYPRNYLSKPSHYNHSPISYGRTWADSYGMGSGFLTGRNYSSYGGLHDWERGYTRAFHHRHRPYVYSSYYYRY